ncbi:dihydrofolate reductase-like isoform X3 [Schistocerca americana]|nr:dihydrofolate reductase-like isoform X3 [Schistocerca americana]
MTKSTTDPLKKNAVVMGRKTWESIPEKFRPLPGRLNVVLTRTNRSLGEEVIVHTSLEDAIKDLHNRQDVETVWVIGGSSVYDEMMKSSYCHRLYITNILKDYNCDTFFPEIGSQYKSVRVLSDWKNLKDLGQLPPLKIWKAKILQWKRFVSQYRR